MVLDYSGQFVVRRITLFKCWPKDYSVSDLDAMQSTVLLDKLVLAVSTIGAFLAIFTGPLLVGGTLTPGGYGLDSSGEQQVGHL